MPGRLSSWLAAASLATSLLAAASGAAQPALLEPPCDGVAASPAPAMLESRPAVLGFTDAATIASWTPRECLGWRNGPADTVVALAARFEVRSLDVLLDHFTALSRLSAVRYWSVKLQMWRPLFQSAVPLDGPDPLARRGDFERAEVRPGTPVHVLLDDDLVGPLVMEILIGAFSPEAISISMRNLSPGHRLGMEVLPIDGLAITIFLEKESEIVWRYWSAMRVATELPSFLLPPPAAHANRLAAIFRYIAGLPTDAEPPLFRDAADLPG